MRPWTRIEQSNDGREGVCAAAQTAPMALVLVLSAVVAGRPAWITAVVCLVLAAVLGSGVHWQARRGRPIKRVYDTAAVLGLIALVGGTIAVLAG